MNAELKTLIDELASQTSLSNDEADLRMAKAFALVRKRKPVNI